MELIKSVIEEIAMRKTGRRGKLHNLSDIELIALAGKLRIDWR